MATQLTVASDATRVTTTEVFTLAHSTGDCSNAFLFFIIFFSFLNPTEDMVSNMVELVLSPKHLIWGFPQFLSVASGAT